MHAHLQELVDFHPAPRVQTRLPRAVASQPASQPADKRRAAHRHRAEKRRRVRSASRRLPVGIANNKHSMAAPAAATAATTAVAAAAHRNHEISFDSFACRRQHTSRDDANQGGREEPASVTYSVSTSSFSSSSRAWFGTCRPTPPTPPPPPPHAHNHTRPRTCLNACMPARSASTCMESVVQND